MKMEYDNEKYAIPDRESGPRHDSGPHNLEASVLITTLVDRPISVFAFEENSSFELSSR